MKKEISPRGLAILERLAKGSTIAGAASDLGISPFTANHHLRRAYARLGVHDKAAAVARILSGPNPQLLLSFD